MSGSRSRDAGCSHEDTSVGAESVRLCCQGCGCGLVGHHEGCGPATVFDNYERLRCELSTTTLCTDIGRGSTFRQKRFARWESRNAHVDRLPIVQVDVGPHMDGRACRGGSRC